eukprot:PhM_4_TR9075/c0_g1_i1/m.56429
MDDFKIASSTTTSTTGGGDVTNHDNHPSSHMVTNSNNNQDQDDDNSSENDVFVDVQDDHVDATETTTTTTEAEMFSMLSDSHSLSPERAAAATAARIRTPTPRQHDDDIELMMRALAAGDREETPMSAQRECDRSREYNDEELVDADAADIVQRKKTDSSPLESAEKRRASRAKEPQPKQQQQQQQLAQPTQQPHHQQQQQQHVPILEYEKQIFLLRRRLAQRDREADALRDDYHRLRSLLAARDAEHDSVVHELREQITRLTADIAAVTKRQSQRDRNDARRGTQQEVCVAAIQREMATLRADVADACRVKTELDNVKREHACETRKLRELLRRKDEKIDALVAALQDVTKERDVAVQEVHDIVRESMRCDRSLSLSSSPSFMYR